MEIYLRSGQASDDDIIPCVRSGCLTNKYTNVHSECVMFVAFTMQIILTRTHLTVTFVRALSVLLNAMLCSVSERFAFCTKNVSLVD